MLFETLQTEEGLQSVLVLSGADGEQTQLCVPSAAVTVSTTGTGATGSGSEGSGGGSTERVEGSMP